MTMATRTTKPMATLRQVRGIDEIFCLMVCNGPVYNKDILVLCSLQSIETTLTGKRYAKCLCLVRVSNRQVENPYL